LSTGLRQTDLERQNHGIPPFDGHMDVPCWAARAGAVPELRSAVRGIPTWLVILSVNGAAQTPCIASESTLAATAGIARRTSRRRLAALRRVPGLLLELPRGRDSSSGHFRTTARWATDPLTYWSTAPLIERQIPDVAERTGLDSRWVAFAFVQIHRHDRLAKRLARVLAQYIVTEPGAISTQKGWGGGGDNAEQSV
jgi:hypothetical protein